jgi:hypothetical protein
MSTMHSHLPARAPARSFHPRPVLRLGVRVRALTHRAKLDSMLLDGANPTRGAELQLRANQLTAGRYRGMLARSLVESVEAAEGEHRRSMASVPLAYGEVRAARAALLELANGLRGEGPVAPAGVILAERLVTDGAGPLYIASGHDALWRAARQASAALLLG